VAEDLGACCVVTFTKTGKTALYMSKYNPNIPILGATTELSTYRRMCLHRGVEPALFRMSGRPHALREAAEAEIVRRGLGVEGDIVVYVGGTNLNQQGNINSLKVRRIGEQPPGVSV
jgi:pyruvate kinase